MAGRASLSLTREGNVVRLLRWAVATFAQRKGIGDAKRLAELAELDVATVAGVWGGRRSKGQEAFSKFVEVETLRKLCVALDARPPGVFGWTDEPAQDWPAEVQDGPPYLVWRVRELAEKRGLDRIAFARAARMFYTRVPGAKPTMAERIWAGEHRAIAVVTLASICDVLKVSPGDLFAWDR